MKPGILIIQKRSPALLEALAQDYTVHDYGRADDKDAFVAEISGDVRAVLVESHDSDAVDCMIAKRGDDSVARQNTDPGVFGAGQIAGGRLVAGINDGLDFNAGGL